MVRDNKKEIILFNSLNKIIAFHNEMDIRLIDDKHTMLAMIIIFQNVANTNVSEIIYFTLICCQITTDTKCIRNEVSQDKFSHE